MLCFVHSSIYYFFRIFMPYLIKVNAQCGFHSLRSLELRWRFTMASAMCQDCGRCFSGYASDKGAKSARDRHVRETHTSNEKKRKNVESRILRGRSYAKAAYWTTEHANEAPKILFVVLCPMRRITMFERTREHLVSRGIPATRIERRCGFDTLKRPDIPRHLLVTEFIVKRFLRLARRSFRKNIQLEYIFSRRRLLFAGWRWHSGVD